MESLSGDHFPIMYKLQCFGILKWPIGICLNMNVIKLKFEELISINVDTFNESLVDVIIKIADKAIPKTQAVIPKKLVSWWNPELASLVTKRNKHRRKLKKENNSTDILKEYKE